MRVVLFSHEYPPFLFGGVGTFVKDLAQGLAKLGLDVFVVSGVPFPWNFNAHLIPKENNNITVVRLKYPNLVPRHITFQTYNMVKLKQIVSALRPDVIHGQSGSLFPATFVLKHIAPIVVTFHGSPKMQRDLSTIALSNGGTFRDFFNNGIGYPFWSFGYKKEYKSADACVAVSESLMDQLKLEFSPIKQKLSFIHNGIDLHMLDKNTQLQNCSNPTPKMIYGGRLFWNKGVLNITKLAYLLQKNYNVPLKIVIYGSGPMYKKILGEKRRFNLENLEVKPFLSRETFLKDMMESSFVLLPSYYEGSPMLILESMCLGITPVMFDLPYSREFTQNGVYGILASNLEDMAEKVVKSVITNSYTQQKSKIKGFARKNFDGRNTAVAYHELYKKLL